MPGPQLRRQEKIVRRPFGGLDHSVSTEELEATQQSVAEEVKFERGYVTKLDGRVAVGDSVTTPLNGKILKLYVFEKLDGQQRILAFTRDKIYTWAKGATSWTDITGTVVFNANSWSVVTYINKVYFTTDGPEDIYYWDIGDSTCTALAAGYTGKVLAVFGERLHILNTYESATWNRQRDRWSNLGLTTFSVNSFNDLVSFMGDDGIEHAELLASSLVAYGGNTILEISYTGATTVPFAYRLCSVGCGLTAPRGFVNLRDSHAFLSGDGVKIFDLSLVPKAIDQKVNEWLFENMNLDYIDRCVLGKSDKLTSLVLYFPENGETDPSHFLRLNLSTGVWTEGSRGATAACPGSVTGRLAIDELDGTLDQLSGNINFQGAPGTGQALYVGDENGSVFSEFDGIDIEGTGAVVLDYQTKDFCFDDEAGAAWMGLEFEARGDYVAVDYSLDQGRTWHDLSSAGEIDDIVGTINAQTVTIDELTTQQDLTAEWLRYRMDFEGVSKTCRFRFQNSGPNSLLQLRWLRIYVLRTSAVGTLPT